MSSHHYIANNQLQQVIHSAWQVDHLTNFATEHIVPKGRVEIIFNFSDPVAISATLCGQQYELPRCFINGFNKCPIQVKLPNRQVYFGIILQPLACQKILKIPAGEFSNITVDLTLINKTFEHLWQQLAIQRDFKSRIAVIQKWSKQHEVDWPPQDQQLNNFLYDPAGFELSVTEVAGRLCYSPRQLSRKMIAISGMNTEEILQYKKYLQSLHLLQHTKMSLTGIAYHSKFADQSHFIRTFKTYTGLTPSNYQRDKSHVEGHLYYNVR